MSCYLVVSGSFPKYGKRLFSCAALLNRLMYEGLLHEISIKQVFKYLAGCIVSVIIGRLAMSRTCKEHFQLRWVTRGKKGKTFISMHFFVFAMKIFYWHLNFIYFGIYLSFVIPKEEFGKDNFDRGIELNFLRLNWKNCWMICKCFFVWKWAHVADCKDTVQTCDQENSTKNGWSSHSITEILGHVSVLRKWLGNGQDISN